ncbi:ATP-dependent (S)-NAD(P)H-hydrate dehydratase isoform X1 [Triticum aestivum]|uniref:ATP-dependent (S)-NAD(P)H-hydrate dehydratase isoform X1 n=1 Tax=Triticum aestivum TaxID=4565 RepID=UPI001D018EAA|nr:ATP-dependent (S)-NAD(P)H-hydrate dehydratase-like isoform X1 [Triticum aestivum]
MWAASPAFRMQLFLLRSLVPTCVDDGHASSSYLRPRAMYATSADAESVIQRITPPLDRARHKGQTGSYLSMPICCSMKIQVDSKVVLLGSGGALVSHPFSATIPDFFVCSTYACCFRATPVYI